MRIRPSASTMGNGSVIDDEAVKAVPRCTNDSPWLVDSATPIFHWLLGWLVAGSPLRVLFMR